MVEIKGGRAFLKGVSIDSSYGRSLVLYDKTNNNYKIQVWKYSKDESKKGALLKLISKIPFIRSFLLIYNAVRKNKKIFIVTLIAYFVFVMTLVNLPLENAKEIEHFLSEDFKTVMSLFIIAGIFVKVTPLSNYHGAEHMVINTYLAYEGRVTYDLAKKASRVSTNCGSVLVLTTIIIYVFFELVSGMDSTVAFILAYMIGYEIFKGKPQVLSPIIKISSIIQKYILTSQPNKTQLSVAIIAIKRATNKI